MDETRPQDRADTLALLKVASDAQMTACRDALRLIERRGYARGKALTDELDSLLTTAK